MFKTLQPVSRLVSVADTTTQLIPWLVLAVLGIGVLIVAFGPSRQMLRVVRTVALIAALSGVYGLYIHVKANYDAALLDFHFTDRWPHMSLMSKLWAAGSGQVGPSPVMAPAVLSQCAVCLALATLRHPKLVSARARATAPEHKTTLIDGSCDSPTHQSARTLPAVEGTDHAASRS